MSYYKTIFISDTHLGGPCNHTALQAFLDTHDADTWYLVGDFFDFWAGKWKTEDFHIVQTLINKNQKIILLPGNHDSLLRSFEYIDFGSIEIVDKTIFTSSNGKHYLVLHGDLFDAVIGHAVWLAYLGAVGYNLLIGLNQSVNFIRKVLHLPYWSFSAAIKKAVKAAVAYVSDFKQSLIELCHLYGTDGVICGHIHTPEHTFYPTGVEYINTGDWVESLTAVVELPDGTLELKYYASH